MLLAAMSGVVLLLLLILVGVRCSQKPARPAVQIPDMGTSGARLERTASRETTGLAEMTGTTPTTTLPPPTTTAEPTTTAPLPGVGETVTVVGGGDVLMHTWLLNGGRQSDGSYDYDYMLKYLRPVTTTADVALADMEGTLAGEPYTGYPQFSSPDAVARAIVAGGFNHALSANNHAIDRGTAGLQRTAEVLQAAGLTVVGTRAAADWPRFTISEHRGIKIGVTGWTYETVRQGDRRALNGILMPEDVLDLINSFSIEDPWMTEDFNRMAAMAGEMREAGADLVVFFLHWGTEYQTTPAGYQTALAQRLCDAGVDLVIGNGPHVMQPIHVLTSTDGSHEMLCYYSVGNMVTDQYFDTANNQGFAEDGLLAHASFMKQADGSMRIARIAYLDFYCYKNKYASAETLNTPIPITAGLESPGSYGLNGDQLWMLRNSADRTASVMARNETGDYSVERLSGY